MRYFPLYRGTLFKDKLKNNNIPHGKTGNGLKWKYGITVFTPNINVMFIPVNA